MFQHVHCRTVTQLADFIKPPRYIRETRHKRETEQESLLLFPDEKETSKSSKHGWSRL